MTKEYGMLQLVLGRSGYGKTHWIRERIKEVTAGGRRAILLVPEQFSFESERALYYELGAKTSMQVEVLSFTRLAHAVFRAYGGTAARYAGEGGKNILLTLAIGEVADGLKVYRRNASSLGFVRKMADAVSEFKRYGVTPALLREKAAAAREGSDTLSMKAEELALIYDAYNAMLERGYADSDDDLTRALDLLRQHPFFAGATVFVDEFKGFTVTEFAVLERIIAGAEDTYVTLCAEDIYDREDGLGLFSRVQAAADRLKRLAAENHIPVASPIRLKKPMRFHGAELVYLERSLFAPGYPKMKLETMPVQVVRAKHSYEELEFVCASIAGLVRERGMRYRDFVVIGREMEDYYSPFQLVMKRYGIPFFYGFKEPLYIKPLSTLVLSLLKAAIKGFDSDAIFSALKTGLTRLTTEDISALENYAYTWNIQGRMWTSPFAQNPRGFTPTFTDDDNVALEAINEARAYIMEPLLAFRTKIREANGLDFARQVYELLQQLGISEVYARIIDELEGHNRAEEYLRVWDMVCDLLDEFGEILKNTVLPSSQFVELFELMLQSMDLGEIPQTLDQVLVGDASLIRPDSPKIAFVIGANEGKLPLSPSYNGVFTESERKQLIDLGLELPDISEKMAVDEQFVAYKALTAASDQVIITYPVFDLKGKPLYPSPTIKDICERLGCQEQVAGELPADFYAQNDLSALYSYMRLYRKDTEQRATLEAYLQERTPQLVKGLISKAHARPDTIRDEALGKELYGNSIRLSPTRVERFYNCRFAYFVEHGLQVNKRNKADLSPIAVGSLIHYALQMLMQKYGDEFLTVDMARIKVEIGRILEEYIGSYMGGVQDKTKRFKYLYTRLSTTLVRLVEQLRAEFAQSEFRPVDFELELRRGGQVKPIELLLPDGSSVWVEGIVDRVDIFEKKGQKYIRVVDYKTGGKDFRLSDVYYGINMQMLLYLFAVWQNGFHRYGNILPAGVLYMPAQATAINMDREATGEALEQARLKSFRMQGLVLDDPEIIQAMDASAQGIFINTGLNKEGSATKTDAVATLAELGKLKSYAEKLVGQMAQELRSGVITANPSREKAASACDWCQYKGICGHEEEDSFMEVEPLGKEALFERIGGAQDGGKTMDA